MFIISFQISLLRCTAGHRPSPNCVPTTGRLPSASTDNALFCLKIPSTLGSLELSVRVLYFQSITNIRTLVSKTSYIGNLFWPKIEYCLYSLGKWMELYSSFLTILVTILEFDGVIICHFTVEEFDLVKPTNVYHH